MTDSVCFKVKPFNFQGHHLYSLLNMLQTIKNYYKNILIFIQDTHKTKGDKMYHYLDYECFVTYLHFWFNENLKFTWWMFM